MHYIDWILTAVPLVALVIFALWTSRFVRGVADYVSGGRIADRYLLANAAAESGSGVTNTVANFEMFMIAGFITIFWGWVTVPVGIMIAITGYVMYRYRETRCMTMAEFFERRYSPRLRLFMGFLGFLAGVLNYGVFPYVSAQLFVYFLDLPVWFEVAGWVVPTYVPIMATYLTIATFLVTFGGQVTLMVTDCVEGIFSHAVYLLLIVLLLWMVPWKDVSETLVGACPTTVATQTAEPANAVAAQTAEPATAVGAAEAPAKTDPCESIKIQSGHSPVNPFDATKTKGFNIYTCLLGIFGMFYLTGAWQGGHMFRSAARSPHEARMGGILSSWRGYARTLVLVVLVICTMTYLRHPHYAKESAATKERIGRIYSVKPQRVETLKAKLAAEKPVKDAPPVGSQRWYEEGDMTKVTQIQKQQSVSVALSHLLPVGIKGLFLVIMIMGLFAGDGNHLLSWSTILVQDVIVPVRRRLTGRTISPEGHLKLLRWGVVIVALSAFTVSSAFCVMPLEMPIWFWWGITGTLYSAGAGALILGGLYTRWGNSAGAWASIAVGPTLSVAAMVIDFMYPKLVGMTVFGYTVPASKPYNMLLVTTAILVVSAIAYVIASLVFRKEPCNLDNLLHRGEYADAHTPETGTHVSDGRLPAWMNWRKMVGIDSNFTKADTFVAAFVFFWSLFLTMMLVFTLGWRGLAASGLVTAWSNDTWATFWLWFGLVIPGVFTVVTLVWFGIGGWIDIRRFFKDLKTMKRDHRDDGQVH